MLSILERLQRGEILISDGAMGTMLFEKGLPVRHCPEEWNVSHPDEVKSIAAAYFNAGSDMVLTNTFGGSGFKLSNFGFEKRVKEFNKAAAELAKSAAPEGKFVAGSVGPTGKFLQPVGEVTEDEMFDCFCDQISALIEGGIDAVCIETMTDLSEAGIAIKAAKEVSSNPVISTMTFDRTPRGYFTMMGVTPEQAVISLKEAGADIIGTNCGNGIEQMTEIIRDMRKYTDMYLLAHPNAGLPKLVDGKSVYTQTPEGMAAQVHSLLESGINIVGGCCGTTPEHIKRIAESVKNR